MTYFGLLLVALVALAVALRLVLCLGTVWWEDRGAPWSLREAAGFALCWALPVALFAVAYVCVHVAETGRAG